MQHSVKPVARNSYSCRMRTGLRKYAPPGGLVGTMCVREPASLRNWRLGGGRPSGVVRPLEGSLPMPSSSLPRQPYGDADPRWRGVRGFAARPQLRSGVTGGSPRFRHARAGYAVADLGSRVAERVRQADLTLRSNPAMVRSRWIGIHGDRVGGWNGAGTRSPVAGIEGRFAVAERIRARNAFAVRACESLGPARGCCCFAMLPAAFGAWSPGLAGAPHHACIQSGRSRPALGGIRR